MEPLAIKIIAAVCELFAILSMCCIVLFVHVIHKTGRLKKFPPFLLLCSYAILDFGSLLDFSTLIFPLVIFRALCNSFPEELYARLSQMFYVVFLSNKPLHLCVIAIDRFIAVYAPLFYRVHVTRRVMLIIILLIWMLPLLAYIM